MKPINLGKVSSACDNVTCQRNELEALEAIFAEDFCLLPLPPTPPAEPDERATKAGPVTASPALIGSPGVYGVLAEEEDDEISEATVGRPPMLNLARSSSLLSAGPPFHVQIYLRPFPANPEANHVAIYLHAVIPRNYPDEVPAISVCNVIGMPKAQVDTLEEQLRALTQELRGSEMIYQLTEAAMQYLFRHNVPLQKGSLHDQMIDFAKEQQKSEALGHTTRTDKEKLRHRLKQKRLKAMYEQQLSESERPLMEDDGTSSDSSQQEKRTPRRASVKDTPRRTSMQEMKPGDKTSNEALAEQNEEEDDEEDEGDVEETSDELEDEGDEADSADIFQTKSLAKKNRPPVSRESSEAEGNFSESDDDDDDDSMAVKLPSPSPPLEPEAAAGGRTRLSSFRDEADPKDVFSKSQMFLSPSPFLTSISAPPSSSLLNAISLSTRSSSENTTSTSGVSTSSVLASLSQPSISSVTKLETNFPNSTRSSKANKSVRRQSESMNEDEGDESEKGVDLLNEFQNPPDMDFLLGGKGAAFSKKLEVSRRKKTDLATPSSTPSVNKDRFVPTPKASPSGSDTLKTTEGVHAPLISPTSNLATKPFPPSSASKPLIPGYSSESGSFSESESEDEGDEFDIEDDEEYLKDFRSPLDMDFLRSVTPTTGSGPSITPRTVGQEAKQPSPTKPPTPKTSFTPRPVSRPPTPKPASRPPTPQPASRPSTPASRPPTPNPTPKFSTDKPISNKLMRASEEDEEGDSEESTSEMENFNASLLEEFSAPLDLDRLRNGVKPEKPSTELKVPPRKIDPKSKTTLVKSKSEIDEDDEDSYANDDVDDELRTYMGRPAIKDFALRPKPKKGSPASKHIQTAKLHDKLADAKIGSTSTSLVNSGLLTKDRHNKPPKQKPKAEKVHDDDDYMDMDESRYRYGMTKGARRATTERAPSSSESRYQHDFDEIEVLGKGAFGVVVKARNKIDGAYYAVKKMGVDETDKEVLREVVALASLHHHHIVRYYQAWYEPMTPELLKQLPSEETDSENTYTSGPGGPPNSVLYIQMEFCSGKTLKTFITESKNVDPFTKPRRKKMIWTLFRQMLEALAFIHSKHMLHRDIKPENVFLDSTGSVKLGDFGLAVGDTATKTLPVLQRQSSYITGIMNSHPEQTLEIGTMMYSAPEQMGSRHGGYGPSADIYSLGIVFLEMWQPFGSSSEKAACIGELRRTETVPDSCNYLYVPSSKGRESRERARVKFIVEWLVKQDPHARPTAEGLLASKMIPVLIDHPHFKTALRALEQPESELRLKILHQLFTLPVEDHVDFTFDHHSHKTSAGPEGETLAVLRDFLTRIFRKHGAQWFTPPILVPRTQKVDIARKATVILLDHAGIPVEVCGHPTLSFARWAAKTSAMNVRRFEIGRELEATTDLCTAPIEHLVGSFDIVWSPEPHATVVDKKRDKAEDVVSSESRCAFLQAEIIQVASELMGCLGPAIGPTMIYVNHTRLLESLIELCICVNNEESPDERRKSIKEEDEDQDESIHGTKDETKPKEETEKAFIMRVLREQRNVSRQKLQDQLLNRGKHIAADARKRHGDVIDLLMTFLELKGPLHPTLETLKEMTYVRTFLNSKKRYEGSESLRVFLAELENLCCALRSFGFEVDTPPDPKQETPERHIMLDLVFVPRYLVFQGVVVQACQNPPSHPLIVGGCYEHLLERFRPPDEHHAPQSAMGLSVHIPRILECCRVRHVDGASLRRLINRNNVCVLPEEAERVVLFADKGKMLTERAMLAGELWQRGVKAELQSDFNLRQAVSYCVDNSIRFLVRFRVKTFAERRSVELQIAPFPLQGGTVMSINDVILQICQEGKTSALTKLQPPMKNVANINPDIEVKIVGGATKAAPMVAKIRKKLAPFVAMNPHRFSVVAISLSIILIRAASHAFLQDRFAETQRSPFFGPTPVTPTRSRGKSGPQQVVAPRPSSPKLIGRTGRRGSESNIVIPERKSEMFFKNFMATIPKDKSQLLKAYHAFLLSVPIGTEFLFTYSLEEDKLDMLPLT